MRFLSAHERSSHGLATHVLQNRNANLFSSVLASELLSTIQSKEE
jgi:hypothetical protein